MITAENMKEALESHGGLRGCRVAVVQVDSTKSVGVENKIPGISLLNNFLFKERGVRAWKAYKVGGSILGSKISLVGVFPCLPFY